MAIGPFTPANFAIGFVLAFITLRLCIPREIRGSYYSKVGRAVRFSFFVVVELVIANIKMAYYTLSPLRKLKPGVLAVPLEELSDTELTILANLITLTPGTLSLDVTEDCNTLFIHAMFADDPDEIRRQLKTGMERWVIEAME